MVAFPVLLFMVFITTVLSCEVVEHVGAARVQGCSVAPHRLSGCRRAEADPAPHFHVGLVAGNPATGSRDTSTNITEKCLQFASLSSCAMETDAGPDDCMAAI
jgi:hypothetical protein